MKKIKTKSRLVLNRPFDLFKSPKQKLITAISMAAFVWFFLFSFGVFDFDYFSLPDRFYYSGIYSLSCFIIVITDLFVREKFLLKARTLGEAFIWGLWIMFWISLSNYMLTTLYFQWEEFSIYVLLKNQLYVLGIGFIFTPILLLLNQNFLLRIRVLEVINSNLNKNLVEVNQQTNKKVIINSKYKDGTFETDINNLLYIQSSDNYVDIWYKQDNSIEHRLIRNTLSEIEQSKSNPELVRCHRSYIVNQNQIKSIKSDAGRYKIVFENSNIELPISRKYKNRLLSYLGNNVVVHP